MTKLLTGLAGIVLILLVAVALSSDRTAIRPRVVGAAFALQAGIALLVLYVPWGKTALGFLSKGDRATFVQLQAIQGVGPKAALSVLDILSPAELAAAVARDDKTAVGRANGVGPKLAQRIVTELKGKPLVGGFEVGLQPAPGSQAAPVFSRDGEALAALAGLGIPDASARRAVEAAKARLDPEASLSALIKASLQEVGR